MSLKICEKTFYCYISILKPLSPETTKGKGSVFMDKQQRHEKLTLSVTPKRPDSFPPKLHFMHGIPAWIANVVSLTWFPWILSLSLPFFRSNCTLSIWFYMKVFLGNPRESSLKDLSLFYWLTHRSFYVVLLARHAHCLTVQGEFLTSLTSKTRLNISDWCSRHTQRNIIISKVKESETYQEIRSIKK